MCITLFFLNVLFVCALFLVDSRIGNIENVDSREKRIGFWACTFTFGYPDMAHVYVDVIRISG